MEGTCKELRENFPGIDAVLGELLEPLKRSVSECDGEVVDFVVVVSARSLNCGGIQAKPLPRVLFAVELVDVRRFELGRASLCPDGWSDGCKAIVSVGKIEVASFVLSVPAILLLSLMAPGVDD
jgi:hypothetical protein